MADPSSEINVGGLLDLLPAALYLAQPGSSGQWFYASPQIEAILGFSAADFIADPGLWNRQLYAGDRDRVLHAEAVDRHGGRTKVEYRMVRKDGQLVWVLDDARLATLPSYGSVQHGLLYDINERKRTEQQLAAHSAILERLAVGAEVCDVLVELAAATEQISGTGRCVITVPAERDQLLTPQGGIEAHRLRQLGPVAYRVPFLAPDGEPLGAVALYYPDGPPQQLDRGLADWAAGLATVAVQRETDRSRFTTSVSLLQATLDSTADGIAVTDRGGELVGYNQKFVDMWLLDPDEIERLGGGHVRSQLRSQLCDPDAVHQATLGLHVDAAASGYDELHLLDGRIFERFSQPQFIGGEPAGRVYSFRDMTRHRQLERELRAHAFSDTLTALPNRSYFLSELSTELGRAGRNTSALAVLLLDLDDFKTVNDSLGPVPGDKLLIAVADRLQACLRPGDVAARLGGDEFGILLHALNGPQDALAAADRILAEVSRPLTVDGQVLSVQASVGIALPSGAESAAELLRNADLAMYDAKRAGGGRRQRYAPPMHAEAMARLALKADLERALDEDELIVHYQPVWDLATGEIVSLEALVRWPHPTRGLIPPAEFIPLAEESRLIDRVGSAVLAQSCAQLAGWRRTVPEYGQLGVSVNLSPRQLSDDNLVGEIRQALWVAGLPASALTLEITETSLADPNVDVVRVLTELKALGVALALDDFGVGYSSLTQLVRFPLDIVKIDKSFVDRIVEDPAAAALFRAVLQVTDALSLSATVEGVEHGEQLAQIRAAGCDRAQGFLLARPMTAAAIADLLQRQGRAGTPTRGSAEWRHG